SIRILCYAGLYQLPHEGGRQRFVRLEADGALAGVIVFELVLVGRHGGRTHEVEGAVVRGRAEGHQHAVLAERGKLVADALFRLGRLGSDGLSKLLERGSLVVRQGREVLVDGLGLGGHGACSWTRKQEFIGAPFVRFPGPVSTPTGPQRWAYNSVATGTG